MFEKILLSAEKIGFPGLGIDGLEIDNVAFRVGSLTIYWYGVILATALFVCVLLAMLQAKKNHFSADLTLDVALVSFPAAIVGARLYYVLSEWQEYRGDIMSIINIRKGGLGVIGGVLAAILAGYILTRVKKIPAHVVFDYCIVYIPLGQAIGRWGNFFNQEAFGTNTNLPWGMTGDNITRYLQNLKDFSPVQDPNLPVHPTFLYESLANIVIFFVLLAVRKKSKYAFTVTAGYLVLYGAARFFIEGLRTDSLYIADTGLRLSQVTSVMMILVGIALIVISKWRDWKRITIPVEHLMAKNIHVQGDPKSEDEMNIIASTDIASISEDVADNAPENEDRTEQVPDEGALAESSSDTDGIGSDSEG